MDKLILYADTETVTLTTENYNKIVQSEHSQHIQKKFTQSQVFVSDQLAKAKEENKVLPLQVVNVLCQGVFSDDYAILEKNIKTFFAKAAQHTRRTKHKSLIVYFHNMKFDILNILDYFYSENIQFTLLDCVIVNTTYYQIKFFFRGVLFDIRDSYKLCMMKLADFGRAFNLDKKFWKKDYTFDNSIESINKMLKGDLLLEDYGMTDVYCLRYGLEAFRQYAHSDKTTIASCAFDDWKKKGTVELAKLSTEEQTFANYTYTGGICTYNKEKCGQKLDGEFIYIDNNGLYSAAIYSQIGKFCHPYPVGVGRFYTTGKPDFRSRDKFYTIKARIHAKVKDWVAVPFFRLGKQYNIGVSLSRRYKQNEYIQHFNETCYINSIDLCLLYQYYDVYEIEFIEWYEYNTQVGLFDSYVDEWIGKKTEGTITGNKPLRTTAKMMNNSLTGKFGQFILPVVTSLTLSEHGLIEYERKREDKEPSFIYMPIVSAILSYAREIFLDMTTSYPKEYFLYCDTDSNIMYKEAFDHYVDKKKIHPTALGLWDVENELTSVKILRQKTYMMTRKDGQVIVKCAGASDAVKKYITYDNFELGKNIVDEKGKLVTQLKPTIVAGGLALVDTPFSIKESSFFH